jgi:8-oxo-dGTP diphosphatase
MADATPDATPDARPGATPDAGSRAAEHEHEREFLASYDPRAFPPVAVTVDVVALTIRDAELQVLLIQRREPPYQHQWALPGGFVRQLPGPDGPDGEAIEEDLAEAAARELAEEAGPRLRTQHLEQLKTYGAPGRDPRMRIVSVAYLAFAPEMPELQAGSDAADAQWVPVSALGLSGHSPGGQRPGITRTLAFDHARILADGLERARAKLEYTPLATAFVTEPFTIAELREVYETVWGEKLHPGNFHRKILSVPGFVDSTGDLTSAGGPKGGPRSKLYRRGDAALLHPALLRPDREEEVR